MRNACKKLSTPRLKREKQCFTAVKPLIINKGEPADKFYIILQGSVNVLKSIPEDSIKQQILQRM